MRIGAQFYTIRESCKDLASFAESLKKVADIGYRYVQISGTCPFEGAWLKEELDKNGLTCVLTHTPKPDFANPEAVVREHDAFGCKYIGLGHHRFNEEDPKANWDAYLAAYSRAVDVFAEHGKYFMHHNHAHEFQKKDGKLIMDLLAEQFPKEKFGFTLDTYWVQVGGADSADWLERLTGRVPCIHLKDYSYGAKMSVVGEGNINFDRVFAAAEDAGTEYMLVEQDDCYGEDPFDCLKRSYEFLKARGFE